MSIKGLDKFNKLIQELPKTCADKTRYNQFLPFLQTFSNTLSKSPSVGYSEPLFTSQLNTMILAIKFLIYLSAQPSPNQEEQDVWDKLIETLTHLPNLDKNSAQNSSDEINQLIKKLLNKKDYQKAKNFFLAHPGERFCGSSQGTVFSYIKSVNGEIFQRHDQLGKGSFGRTKKALNLETNETIAIKRQLVSQINQENLINKLRIEANINLDCGLAVTPLEMRIKEGKVYKVYQGMKNLGCSLDSHLKNAGNADPMEKRLDYAIQLLLKVDDLHTGKASKTQTSYTHCDIKPANVCLDEQGQIHLIDFGFARKNDLNKNHIAQSGTPLYMPINFTEGQSFPNEQTCIKTPSYFFDDKIAVLRTIYHQSNNTLSILKKDQFEKLPTFIQEIFKTNDIQRCLGQNYALTSIAAVLIHYQKNPNCSENEIHNILSKKNKALKIIENYQQLSKFNNPILENSSEMKQSPTIPTIPFFFPFYKKNINKSSLALLINKDSLTEEEKERIRKAFNETPNEFTKNTVIKLYTNRVLSQEQIIQKDAYKYDLDILPVNSHLNYWENILKNPSTPITILLDFIQKNTVKKTAFLEIIIANPSCESTLISKMLEQTDLTIALMEQFIPKVFAENIDNDMKEKCLNHLRRVQSYTLKEDEYQLVLKYWPEIPNDYFPFLLAQANSLEKMRGPSELFKKRTPDQTNIIQIILSAKTLDFIRILGFFASLPETFDHIFYNNPKFVNQLKLGELSENKRKSFFQNLGIILNNCKNKNLFLEIINSPQHQAPMDSNLRNIIVNHPQFQQLRVCDQVNFLMRFPSFDDIERFNSCLTLLHDDLPSIIDTNTRDYPDVSLITKQIQKLALRQEDEVIENIKRLLLKVIYLKSCSITDQKTIYKHIRPQMESIQKHRGILKTLKEWMKKLFKKDNSLTKYSMFNTKTENLVHQYVDKIKNFPTK